MPTTVDVRRAGGRRRTDQPGITSWHCFSSGVHYDPDNTHFGPLVTCDEHRVTAGAGFARHRHAGLTIVSWAVEGTLRHEDGDGVSTEVTPGWVQQICTATGVEHGEFAGGNVPARFVQMALLVGPRAPVAYECRPVPPGECSIVTTCATARGTATLRALRPATSTIWLSPGADRFLFVVRGGVTLGGVTPSSVTLTAGDSVRARGDTGLALAGVHDAEVIAWDLP